MTSAGSTTSQTTRRVWLVFWLCLLALPLFTPELHASPQNDRDPLRVLPADASRLIIEGWQEDLDRIEEKVKAGEAKEAKKNLRFLLDGMTQHFHSGPLVNPMLARASVLRAAAEVALGDQDLGAWYWHVAHQMHPQIASTDFSSLGEAGVFLETIEPRFLTHEEAEVHREKPDDYPGSLPENIEAPRKRKAPRPRFPKAKRGLIESVSVVVQVIIDKKGIPRAPLVVEARGEPTMVFAVFETLHEWRFRPARLDGEPVSVFYNLTVNFK